MLLKNKKIKLFFSFFLLLLVFILGASFFIAQNSWAADRELEVKYPQIPGAGVEAPTDVKTFLPNYILYIFYFSLAMSGFIAFGSLVYGGFRYLTSAGSTTAMAEGRKQILAAILGLVILFSSYLILTTVNPQLKIFSLTREPIQEITPPSVDQLTKNQFTNAREIPVGAYIANTLEEKRLNAILAKAKSIKEASYKVQTLSEELKNKTGDCACEKTSPNCGTSQDCGGAFCSGDPCPTKDEILKTKTKLRASVTALNKAIGDPILQQQRNSLKNDWTTLELFGDIMMKGCPAPPINLNEMASLQKLDKDIKIQKPLGMETTNDPANFYCFLTEEQLKELRTLEEHMAEGAYGFTLPGQTVSDISVSPPIIPSGEAFIWPTQGIVTTEYGYSTAYSVVTGLSDFHPGIDIANAIGTPIWATADGRVSSTGDSERDVGCFPYTFSDGSTVCSGPGKWVMIDHQLAADNYVSSAYYHLSQVLVSPGQDVKKGDIVGLMGTSGLSTGSHVHFQIFSGLASNNITRNSWGYSPNSSYNSINPHLYITGAPNP